jgi:hypothetical protein
VIIVKNLKKSFSYNKNVVNLGVLKTYSLLEPLIIQETRKTPMVKLDPDGKLFIEGRSIPEDAGLFYENILDWISRYSASPKQTTTIDIALEYLNSGTSKYMLQVLKRLKDLAVNDKKIKVNWYYEEGDDDIVERGEYYASILDIEINYKKIT